MGVVLPVYCDDEVHSGGGRGGRGEGGKRWEVREDLRVSKENSRGHSLHA